MSQRRTVLPSIELLVVVAVILMLGNHGYTLDPTCIPKRALDAYSGPRLDKLEPYAWKWHRTYISDRHASRSDACFVDGHIERVTPVEVYQDNRYWNGLGAEDARATRACPASSRKPDGDVSV